MSSKKKQIKIDTITEIPLDNIVIGPGVLRTRSVTKGLDELINSIKKVGLINPITVCKGENNKYELVSGQRRLLAHHKMGVKTILASVYNRRLSEDEMKIINFTESVMRTPLNREDMIDVCTTLYRKYGSIKDVAEKLGMSYNQVSNYVMYDRLIVPLKKDVDNNPSMLKTALRAQDAVIKKDGIIDEKLALLIYKEMKKMSSIQQKRILNIAKKRSDMTIESIIEEGRKQERITSLRITLGEEYKDLISKHAKDSGRSFEDIITDALEKILKDEKPYKK